MIDTTSTAIVEATTFIPSEVQPAHETGDGHAFPHPLAEARAHCVPRQLNLIPIGGNKKPVGRWKAYQGTMVTDAELSEWITTGRLGQRVHSFGVVTGLISDIVVVDSDTQDGEAWCQKHLPPTPWMVNTARGVHRYYRHGDGAISNKTHKGEPRVDVRGDGGYVVAPFSIHKTGVVYEPVGDWTVPKDDLPPYDPAWLEPLFPEPVTLPHPDAAALQALLQHPPGDVLKRVRAYVAKCQPAVQGQGGDHATFVMCAQLVRDFALSDADALDVLQPWNARCVPPWAAKELKAKIRSARKSARHPAGIKLLQGRIPTPMPTPANPSPTQLTIAPVPPSGAPSPDIAKLPGRRFVTASEFSRAPLNETRLKRLSGRDPIACQLKYKDEFTFEPQFKLWLSMDKPPKIHEASDGFWQRMRLVPFTVSFAGREDRTLKDRLRAEAPGILAWAVRGAVDWQFRGLSVDMPVEIAQAGAAMKDAQEPTAEFVAEQIVRVPDDATAVIGASALYKAYCAWYEPRDLQYRLSQTAFGRSMGRQFASVPRETGKFYVALRLVTSGEKFAERFERAR